MVAVSYIIGRLGDVGESSRSRHDGWIWMREVVKKRRKTEVR